MLVTCSPEAVKKGSQGGIGKRTLIVFWEIESFFFSILAVLLKFQDVVFSYFCGEACPQ